MPKREEEFLLLKRRRNEKDPHAMWLQMGHSQREKAGGTSYKRKLKNGTRAEKQALYPSSKKDTSRGEPPDGDEALRFCCKNLVTYSKQKPVMFAAEGEAQE